MTDAGPVAFVCALLDAVDSLAHPQRRREVAAHARRFTADGVLRPVLEELETGGPYERGLAVVAASVGGDRDWLAARIADEDAFVRGHALRAALSAGVPDTAYETALPDAPAVVRRRLLQAVVTDGRTELADRLIEPLRERWGDAEAARLLRGCSTATVNRLLPGLFPSVTAGSRSDATIPARSSTRRRDGAPTGPGPGGPSCAHRASTRWPMCATPLTRK